MGGITGILQGGKSFHWQWFYKCSDGIGKILLGSFIYSGRKFVKHPARYICFPCSHRG